jgi:hypothetical protein
MDKKELFLWACSSHIRKEIVGFCYTCSDYFCDDCSCRHKQHRKALLSDLQAALEKEEPKYNDKVLKVKELYKQQLNEIATMRKTTAKAIDDQVQLIDTLLNSIKKSMLAYLKKMDDDFQDAIRRSAELPTQCDRYIRMIRRIIDAENIKASDVSQNELKSFCVQFDRLTEGLEQLTQDLERDTQDIFRDFENFQDNTKETLAPLTIIKGKIQVASLTANVDQLRGLVNAEYDQLDSGKTDTLSLDAATMLIARILEKNQMKFDVPSENCKQIFELYDQTNKGILHKTNATDYVKDVLTMVK